MSTQPGIVLYTFLRIVTCSNSVNLSKQCCLSDNKSTMHTHDVIEPVQWSTQLVHAVGSKYIYSH